MQEGINRRIVVKWGNYPTFETMKDFLYWLLVLPKTFKSDRDNGELCGKIGPPKNGDIQKRGDYNSTHIWYYVYVDGRWRFVRRTFFKSKSRSNFGVRVK